MDTEYKHLMMGMIFIKYLSDNFVSQQERVLKMVSSPKSEYYLGNVPRDIKKAIEWINIAFNDSHDLKYWQLMYKALIHEKAGKMKKARQYAKKGLDKAKSNNTPDGINALGIIFKRLNEK